MRSLLITFFLILSIIADPLYAKNNPDDKIRVALKWFYQYQFAGYIMAKEKGFYKNAGLDVTLVERDPSKDYIRQVCSGQAEYGVADTSLLSYRKRGYPVKIIAPIFQHNPMVLISDRSSGIVSPYELKGKKISFQEGIDDAIFTQMFRFSGITSKDYTKVPMDFSYKKFIDGKIDVIAAYITDQPHWIQKTGKELNIINPIGYGVDLYGDILFTTENEANNHPTRVEAFKQATLEGWEYALSHQDETIRTILEHYNTQGKLTYDQLLYEAKTSNYLLDTKLIPLGTINPIRLASMARIYFQNLSEPEVEFLINNIIYDPSSDEKVLGKYWKAFSSIIIVLALLSAILFFYNRRLNHLVKLRTKHLEEAQLEVVNAAKIKENFLSNMSHEIRTPLNAIFGFIKILKKRNQDPSLSKYINVIESSGESLLHIIADILDFSKITNGKIILDIHPFYPHEELGNLLSLFSANASSKQINYLCFIDPNLPSCLEGDATRIKQILSNLLSNALKFTSESGDIRVKIGYDRTVNTLECIVKDSGIGIPKDKIKKIFEPFEQSDISTTRKYGGTGLGLAICHSLTELLGGTLAVQSEENKGAAFILKIPLKQCEIDDVKTNEYPSILFYTFPTNTSDTKFSNLATAYLKALKCQQTDDPLKADLILHTKQFQAPPSVPGKITIILSNQTEEILSPIPGIKEITVPYLPKDFIDILDTVVQKSTT